MRGSCTGMDYDHVLGVVAGSKACIAGFLKTHCRIGRLIVWHAHCYLNLFLSESAPSTGGSGPVGA